MWSVSFRPVGVKTDAWIEVAFFFGRSVRGMAVSSTEELPSKVLLHHALLYQGNFSNILVEEKEAIFWLGFLWTVSYIIMNPTRGNLYVPFVPVETIVVP